MHVFVQACILGLLMGGVYALMASGLALVFGIMRVINVAQGALIIMGAFLSYSLFTRFHIDPFVGVLVIAPAMFVLGIGLQLAFLRPLREQDREELSLLVTWAIALGIEGVLSYAYSTTYRTSITGYANRAWNIAGYRVPEVRLFACVLSFVDDRPALSRSGPDALRAAPCARRCRTLSRRGCSASTPPGSRPSGSASARRLPPLPEPPSGSSSRSIPARTTT